MKSASARKNRVLRIARKIAPKTTRWVASHFSVTPENQEKIAAEIAQRGVRKFEQTFEETREPDLTTVYARAWKALTQTVYDETDRWAFHISINKTFNRMKISDPKTRDKLRTSLLAALQRKMERRQMGVSKPEAGIVDIRLMNEFQNQAELLGGKKAVSLMSIFMKQHSALQKQLYAKSLTVARQQVKALASNEE